MRSLLEVPITFQVEGGVTHAPMVLANVAGVPTRLILDTGSTDHILTTELVGRLGISLEPGEAGTDSTGASVPSWRVAETVVRIGDASFDLRDLVVIEGPAPFQRGGIGGILSPQRLHPSATAVLDLADDRFTLLDGDQASVFGWLAGRFPDMRMLVLPAVAGEGTILIRAAVDGFEPVVTMLDSGAKATQFAARAVPGLVGGQRRSIGRGVGGGEHVGLEAAGQALAVGGERVPVGRLFIGDSIGETMGLVGMDVLRGTVVAVCADPKRPVLWLLPGSAAD